MPSASGITLNVNIVLLAPPTKLLTVALCVATSLAVKPFIACENVAVTGIELELVVVGLVVVSVTVGPPVAANANGAMLIKSPTTAVAASTQAAKIRNCTDVEFINCFSLIN